MACQEIVFRNDAMNYGYALVKVGCRQLPRMRKCVCVCVCVRERERECERE